MPSIEEIAAKSVKATHYTVSCNFDTHKGGVKRSHFVSFGYSVDPGSEAASNPVLLEALQLQGSKLAFKCAVNDAYAQGAMSVEEANAAVSASNANHDHLIAKKLAKAFPEQG